MTDPSEKWITLAAACDLAPIKTLIEWASNSMVVARAAVRELHLRSSTGVKKTIGEAVPEGTWALINKAKVIDYNSDVGTLSALTYWREEDGQGRRSQNGHWVEIKLHGLKFEENSILDWLPEKRSETGPPPVSAEPNQQGRPMLVHRVMAEWSRRIRDCEVKVPVVVIDEARKLSEWDKVQHPAADGHKDLSVSTIKGRIAADCRSLNLGLDPFAEAVPGDGKGDGN